MSASETGPAVTKGKGPTEGLWDDTTALGTYPVVTPKPPADAVFALPVYMFPYPPPPSVVVVVVAFSSRVRIWGECPTVHSPPALFFFSSED